MTNSRIQKMVAIAMLCALAFTVAHVRIPIVAFLRYEPKDVIIMLGGFLYGPLAVVAMSVIVSTLEMFTLSDTGPWGLLMNVLSTCAFAGTASFIYHRRRTLGGAMAGLTVGVIFTTGIMVLWNWLVVPFYLGVPRQFAVGMLVPVFIPFNLFKGTLNSVLIMLIFKPVVTALHKSGLIEPTTVGKRSVKMKWIFMIATLIITAVILVLTYNPN